MIRRLSIPSVPAQSGLTGTSPVAVSAALTGLTPGTTYYERVVATSAGGTTEGSILGFTTPTAPAGGPQVVGVQTFGSLNGWTTLVLTFSEPVERAQRHERRHLRPRSPGASSSDPDSVRRPRIHRRDRDAPSGGAPAVEFTVQAHRRRHATKGPDRHRRELSQRRRARPGRDQLHNQRYREELRQAASAPSESHRRVPCFDHAVLPLRPGQVLASCPRVTVIRRSFASTGEDRYRSVRTRPPAVMVGILVVVASRGKRGVGGKERVGTCSIILPADAHGTSLIADRPGQTGPADPAHRRVDAIAGPCSRPAPAGTSGPAGRPSSPVRRPVAGPDWSGCGPGPADGARPLRRPASGDDPGGPPSGRAGDVGARRGRRRDRRPSAEPRPYSRRDPSRYRRTGGLEKRS